MDQRDVHGAHVIMAMKESLAEIAGRIDRLIDSDTFPTAVRPGFLAAAVRDYPSRGGKRLRPALAFWCCRLLGGCDEAVLYPAAAVEVYHNWTLVHDDIIDQDSFRRNVPTSHYQLAATMRRAYGLSDAEAVRNGRDFAMLCGDVQQAWANALLFRAADHGVPAETVLQMATRMQILGNQQLVSGEALDMELALLPVEQVRPEAVLSMLRQKTGALLQLAAELGALAAGAGAEALTKIGEFAMASGVAFQLRDDYLGLFADEQKLGKALGGDLREAKPTVLLLTALRDLDAESRGELLGYLRREQYTKEDLVRVRVLLNACGAADAICRMVAEYAATARRILADFPDNEARRTLGEFVDYLERREK